jgi:aryl-alcohol dehydrogenase-like predicted oxidoreductase
MTDQDDFLHRRVPAFGKRVFRLGLATNYGLDEKGVRAALDRGVNYLFYTFRSGTLASSLRDVFQTHRDRYAVAGITTIGYFGGSVRCAAERALKRLGTDYLDVFQLGWLGVTAAWTEGTLKELRHLKESSKVRAIGVSIHDRARAGRLADDSPLDLLMIRYNAAHPGAEKDIFPHLAKRNPAVIAYTATCWRKLLKRPSGWTGPVPTAGDCYRFCLTSPHVDVVLSGPATGAQLDENIAALQKGPMTGDELKWMREFGQAVHG